MKKIMTHMQYVIDKNIDAENWWVAANPEKDVYGFDPKKLIGPGMFEKIHGIAREDAMAILLPFLDQVYTKNNITEHAIIYEKWWEMNSTLLKTMEIIVGKEIPVDTITVQIVTGGLHRYTKDRWFMQSTLQYNTMIPPEKSVMQSLHEILHLMVHYYYEDTITSKGLDNSEFHTLKEAQTVILNSAFSERGTDMGYEAHKELREKLSTFWANNQNFDQFIDFGIQCMLAKR